MRTETANLKLQFGHPSNVYQKASVGTVNSQLSDAS